MKLSFSAQASLLFAVACLTSPTTALILAPPRWIDRSLEKRAQHVSLACIFSVRNHVAFWLMELWAHQDCYLVDHVAFLSNMGVDFCVRLIRLMRARCQLFGSLQTFVRSRIRRNRAASSSGACRDVSSKFPRNKPIIPYSYSQRISWPIEYWSIPSLLNLLAPFRKQNILIKFHKSLQSSLCFWNMGFSLDSYGNSTVHVKFLRDLVLNSAISSNNRHPFDLRTPPTHPKGPKTLRPDEISEQKKEVCQWQWPATYCAARSYRNSTRLLGRSGAERCGAAQYGAVGGQL